MVYSSIPQRSPDRPKRTRWPRWSPLIFCLPGLALAKVTDSPDHSPSGHTPAGTVRVTWSKPLIARALQVLNARRVPLTEASLLRKLSAEDLEALRDVVGLEITGQRLFVAAEYHFGSLSAALAAAEITPPRTRKRIISSADLVVRVIKALDDLSIPLNNNYVRTDPYGRIGRVLDARFGPGAVRSESLLGAGVHFFDSWDLALAAADLDARAIRLRHKLTGVLIRRAIRALYDEGVLLHKAAVESDYSAISLEVIESVTKRSVTPGALLQSAVQLYGTWDLALANSGLDPLSIRKDLPAPKLIGVGTANDVGSLTSDEITRALAALGRHQVPLHQAAVRNDLSDRSRQLITQTIGRNLPAAVLYQRAKEVFGNWTRAGAAANVSLRAPSAGCEPDLT